MKIDGKCYPKYEMEIYRVPDRPGQAIVLEDGNVFVRVVKPDGETTLVPADRLKDERACRKYFVDNLAWVIGYHAEKAGMTKAELKRLLIKSGAISK
jgi:hypothetical protein